MPHGTTPLIRANDAFTSLNDFAPGELLDAMSSANTLAEAADQLGLYAGLTPIEEAGMKDLLGNLPPALDAAAFAALRSALGRGFRTQLTWQPGYDYELRTWEVTADGEGLINLFFTSPHPTER